MIRLDSVSKSHGSQILFVNASMSVFRGEKVGLVGPNGSGKSTIFRMIVDEEQPDSGQVAVERGVTVGYFSQDVGEMSGSGTRRPGSTNWAGMRSNRGPGRFWPVSASATRSSRATWASCRADGKCGWRSRAFS